MMQVISISEERLKRREMTIERLVENLLEFIQEKKKITLSTEYSWYSEDWINPCIGYITNVSIGYFIPCMNEISVDEKLIEKLSINNIKIEEVKPFYYYLSM